MSTKSKKKLTSPETVVEDQAADNAASVQMKPSKALAMSQAVTMLGAMSGDDLTQLVKTLQQNSASAAASIPDDAAAKNAASVAMKEDLDLVFGGEELTEEFREKISTLFEAAVSTRVNLELTELEEAFEQRIETEVADVVEQLTDSVDKYMSYIADEWMKENEIAIESSMRTEMAEQFIEGLRDLFAEHYIDMPEERLDVVEEMSAEIDSLRARLDDVASNNIELEKVLAKYTMEEAFQEVAEGLTTTQASKFYTLAEGIEFDGDVDAYSKKLNIIKEKVFNKSSASSRNDEASVLSESFGGNLEDSTFVPPNMQTYIKSISRITKK